MNRLKFNPPSSIKSTNSNNMSKVGYFLNESHLRDQDHKSQPRVRKDSMSFRPDRNSTVLSDISIANTIQAIPIPHNKSDVDAFLDDIFDRALENDDLQKHNSRAKLLHNRIKGGGNKSIQQSVAQEEELEPGELGEILAGTDSLRNATNHLIIPNKDSEFIKLLNTFLKNKPEYQEVNCVLDDKDEFLKKSKPLTIKYLIREEIGNSTSTLFRSNWNMLSNDYGIFKYDHTSSTLSALSSLTSLTKLTCSSSASIQSSIHDHSDLKSNSFYSSSCESIKTTSTDLCDISDRDLDFKSYMDSIGYSLNCIDYSKIKDNLSTRIKGGGGVVGTESSQTQQCEISINLEAVKKYENRIPYVVFQNGNNQAGKICGLNNETGFQSANLHAFIEPNQYALMQSVYTQLVCSSFFSYSNFLEVEF